MAFASKNTTFASTFEVSMYEPVYEPDIKTFPDTTSGLRFALSHNCEVAYPNSKNNDPLHLHPFWELYLHLSDEVSFLANGHLYSLKKGDAIISPAGELHARILDFPTKQEHYCLWLDVPENSPIIDALGSFSSPYIQFDADKLNKLCYLFAEIEKATDANDSLYLSSLLPQVICTLRDTANFSELESAHPPLLQRVLTDINENCTEIRGVKHLCERHFTSPSTLNRLFQKHIHVSPHELLESHKLAFAAKLLTNGESVMSACQGVGFSDCSHFITIFRRKFGVTPHHYKA